MAHKPNRTELPLNTRQSAEITQTLRRASEVTGIMQKRIIRTALEKEFAVLRAQGHDLTLPKED